jgi:Uma2 family endonuclease
MNAVAPPRPVKSIPRSKRNRAAQTQPRIQIDDADWATYEKFLDAIGNRSIRCTYDRGRLELMPPMRIHEHEKKFLGRIVETTTLELEMAIGSCGSMTIRREDLARGFEPAECYYIANAMRLSDLHEPDFSVDPPPDLALEVDITSSSMNRQELYGLIGVPEIWRLDSDEIVRFLHLQPDGTYVVSENSRSFPFLTSEIVNRFLNQYFESGDETAAIRDYRRWLLSTVRPNSAPAHPSQNGA